ncbi:hypothetical protein K8S19_07980 [bacterium]|nr:hypothetical protein [bacterium]
MQLTAPYFQAWLSALKNASYKLVPAKLGLSDCRVSEENDQPSHDPFIGAFVPLATHNGPLLVGIMTTPAGYENLARAFLKTDPDQNLTEKAAANAFRKIAVLLADMCKNTLQEHGAITTPGLPIIIKGCEQLIQKNAANQLAMKWGGIDCAVAVFRQ